MEKKTKEQLLSDIRYVVKFMNEETIDDKVILSHIESLRDLANVLINRLDRVENYNGL